MLISPHALLDHCSQLGRERCPVTPDSRLDATTFTSRQSFSELSLFCSSAHTFPYIFSSDGSWALGPHNQSTGVHQSGLSCLWVGTANGNYRTPVPSTLRGLWAVSGHTLAVRSEHQITRGFSRLYLSSVSDKVRKLLSSYQRQGMVSQAPVSYCALQV